MPNGTTTRGNRDLTPESPVEAGAPAPLDDKSARLLAALVELGQATAGALAEHVRIGYSTTTPKLRKLNELRLAESAKAGNGQTVWRPTDAGTAHPAAARADSAETAEGECVPDATVDDAGAATEVVDPTPAHADTIAADPAEQPIGHQTLAQDAAVGTDTKVREPDEPAPAPGTEVDDDGTPEVGITSVDTTGEADTADPEPEPDASAGDDQGTGGAVPGDAAAVTVADSEGSTADAAEVTSAASAGADQAQGSAAPADDTPSAGSGTTSAAARGTATVRRAPGSLDKAVMVILRAKPDVVFKVGELCKLINQAEAGTGVSPASPGAVVLACQRRVHAGEAILAVEKPASFQFMPGTATGPAPITVAAPVDAGDSVRAG